MTSDDSASVPGGVTKEFQDALSRAFEIARTSETIDRLRWDAAREWGTTHLFFMSLYAGLVNYLPGGPEPDKPWRAWASTSYDGNAIGWFASKDEAKRALEAEIHRAIND